MHTIHHGDSKEILATMPDNHYNACVTDPPYGLNKITQAAITACMQAWLSGNEYRPKSGGFMGHQWDAWVPGPELWREVFRVLRPGAYCAVFAGSRCADLMTLALRLAGFEINDTVLYVYGTGMPHGADLSKEIDRQLGHQRPRNVIPDRRSALHGTRPWMQDAEYRMASDEPMSEESAYWHGTNTRMKPSYEPIILAQKPISESTIAKNLLRWGCGGLHIGSCRVPRGGQDGYPANLITDGSSEVESYFPHTVANGGTRTGGAHKTAYMRKAGGYFSTTPQDSGSAARLFYCTKATQADRDDGLENFYWKRDDTAPIGWTRVTQAEYNILPPSQRGHGNIHPTVKALGLSRYIVRLLAKPGQHIIEPFAGSGSTLRAATLEQVYSTGIELNAEYVEMADARARHVSPDSALEMLAGNAAVKPTPEQCAIGI